MHKLLPLFALAVLSLNGFAQINFEKGYFINNSNERISCFIKNNDWKYNPTSFEYKLTEDDHVQRATLSEIKEFGDNSSFKYIRSTVSIDKSSSNINRLDYDSNPEFSEETVFLKVLIEGKANLYTYTESGLYRYFYKTENSNISPLIHKSYKTADNKVRENNKYKQQLWENLKCTNITMNRIKRIDYTKKDLIHFFSEYNGCHNANHTSFERNKNQDIFNLNIRPRLNSATLSVKNSQNTYRTAELERHNSFGLGMEAEFILPFNKNKWALTLEPNYQSYKTETTANYTGPNGGTITGTSDYSSVEVPIGLRHYFFLNNQSSVFINANYILDFYFNSTLTITTSNMSGNNSTIYAINPRNNLGFGCGLKHKAFSVELRYQTSREILGDYVYYDSKYNTTSFILGYSLF